MPHAKGGRKVAVPAASYWKKDTKAKSIVSGKLVSVSNDKKWRIVCALAQGKTNKECAAIANLSPGWVRKFFAQLVEDLGTVAETRDSIAKGKAGAQTNISNQYGVAQPRSALANNPELLNQPFKALITDPTMKRELNECEVRFCWSYVASNSYDEALKASGLDIGLYKAKKNQNGITSFQKLECYKPLAELRIAHMKSRPEIAKFIAEVREQAIFNVEIDKDYLQKEVMIQVDYLKGVNNMEGRKLLRDFLMMLGKTFGGFTDKIQIDNIDHAAVMKAIADQSGKVESIAQAIARKKREEEDKQIGSQNQTLLEESKAAVN